MRTQNSIHFEDVVDRLEFDVLSDALVTSAKGFVHQHFYAYEAFSNPVAISIVREALVSLKGRGVFEYEDNLGFRVQRESDWAGEVDSLKMTTAISTAHPPRHMPSPRGMFMKGAEIVEQMKAIAASMPEAEGAEQNQKAFALVKLDRAFHATMIDAGSRTLLAYGLCARAYERSNFARFKAGDGSIHQEHEAILDAVKADDIPAMWGAVRSHITSEGRAAIKHVAARAGISRATLQHYDAFAFG